MNEQESLEKFCQDIHQDILAASEDIEEGEFKLDQFTQLVSDYLIEAGEIDDINICYYKARGMQINGYNVSQDEDCIDLFVSIYNQQETPTTVTKTQCEAAFNQAETCLRKGLTSFYESLEESSPVYDAFQRIYELKDQATRCRIYLLTDGIVNQESFKAENEGDISISLHIWDIKRVYRFANSGKKFEPIEIDFEKEYGTIIPCLSLADPASDYKGYLAVIPGAILAKIYYDYGPRLLERNVRSFLQARGNVNKGISKTIVEEPHRFFAYNNGITATAEYIEFDEDDGGLKIKKIRNLQIVNGGQTTASLHHTAKKYKADLSGIYVQAKLSVIPEEHIEDIVPLISKYANTQNKVNDADFSANDPFHVAIESFSRTVWAPPTDGTSKQTKWFYERARGQYLDAKVRENTPAKKRQFELLNPNKQKFTKTDLAKYESVWMQLPHIASLGAQKNFNDFAIKLKDRGKVNVDATYFEHLIAKAILFKRADKIIHTLEYGGYKAQTTNYTVAWLSYHTSQRIDLENIWKRQGLSQALENAIRAVSLPVHRIITNPPNGKNITEWCKRKECWDKIREIEVDLRSLDGELIDIGRSTAQKVNKGIDAPNNEEIELIKSVEAIPADKWFQISKWAKETSNLQSWQRSIAFSIGKIIGRSGSVSPKQAKQGMIILEEARRLGFRFED